MKTERYQAGYNQCLKHRVPVKIMAMPYSSQASIIS